MDSHHANGFGTQLDQSFFDSFRWLDEEEDLDLRLFLDDYHAHLREGAPSTKQRPSFRRRMSITKIPFGRRSSVSSGRPGTKDATTQPPPPIRSPTGSVSNGLTHARRKSRALSLITPKQHAPQPSITAFDPAAAHYQDPEARLKLRVYLASPQKFDEAVEFGFPSADAVSPPLPADAAGKVSRRQSRQRLADGSSNMRTFWTDDDDDNEEPGDILSLSSDQPSSPDLDSPKTPEPLEQQQQQQQRARLTRQHARLVSAGALDGRKTPDGASREMTLRMTLTRPDLRAHEEEIYGWQQQQRPVYQQHSRRPTAASLAAAESRGGSRQGSVEKFPEMDPWSGLPVERGVMRRIWDRVRRG
jgi:hypothetical protein